MPPPISTLSSRASLYGSPPRTRECLYLPLLPPPSVDHLQPQALPTNTLHRDESDPLGRHSSVPFRSVVSNYDTSACNSCRQIIDCPSSYVPPPLPTSIRVKGLLAGGKDAQPDLEPSPPSDKKSFPRKGAEFPAENGGEGKRREGGMEGKSVE
ncbi:unnamed protein product [Nezara viridula]|uniref:Uncharacterized protein n=1 Tax=Nezara viridula TaxID=85310 RepID=A0A9P0MUT4_NEZVI|nr:unnamed protein product [Nezara viridula]